VLRSHKNCADNLLRVRLGSGQAYALSQSSGLWERAVLQASIDCHVISLQLCINYPLYSYQLVCPFTDNYIYDNFIEHPLPSVDSLPPFAIKNVVTRQS